ncbi:hypothetical protein GTO91_02865 [Heliobacterium undosum]|uniref:Thymidylate synthase n=1 Tax=Heliomicrobium undosum TaxID=121734 RepID=A0A845L2E1_9FIRM|nr:hypothetical protein [Heliomicrobium undosum]MZP28660.1 hypothetical protein [Heliomicrobium undosum]
MSRFTIDLTPICWSERTHLEPERLTDLRNLEQFINENYVKEGCKPVQHGRVIALRSTDKGRKSSAFASALYLGKYDDMGNTDRFLNGMVKAGHSYEPIRGETVTFLFIGVSKTVYDHLITYTLRNRRIAGGFRANKPWGYVIPYEARDPWLYHGMMEEQLARCKQMKKDHPREPLQAIRSLYPMGVMMPPFMLDFSEEALVKHVFKQRIWERGAQEDTHDVVTSMFETVRAMDPLKWDTLKEHHGPHMEGHNRAMRKLREKRPTLRDLISQKENAQADLMDLDVYELLMDTVGKLPKTMWDKAS